MGWRAVASTVGVELGIFAFFCVAAVAMTWPLASDPGSLTADLGVNDPLLNARFLRNAMEWLLGNRSGPFDGDFFFPHPESFASTDPAIGVALVALPFRLFTDNYLWLVNVTILATFPLAAHGAYLMTRQLSSSRGAAIVGGLAFSFCFYRLSQLDHVTILQMQWLPYGLYFIHKLRDRPTWANGLGVAVMVFLNGVGSANVGLYTTPLFPVVGLWCFVSASPQHRWRFAATLAVSGAVALAALVPFYAPFLLASDIYDMQRDASAAQQFSAKLEQFLQVPAWSWLYGKRSPMPLGLESVTFVGVVVFVFASLAFAARRLAFISAASILGWRRALYGAGTVPGALGYALAFVALVYLSLVSPWWGLVFMLFLLGGVLVRLSGVSSAGADLSVPDRVSAAWLYLVIGLLYAMLSLGPQVFHQGRSLGRGPWTFLLDLPGYGSVRTPSRFFLVTELCVAVLAALGVRAVLELVKTRLVRVVIVSAVSALLLAELWVAPIPTRTLPPIGAAPAVYHWLARQPGLRPILEVPLYSSDMRYRMYFQMLHGRPTVDAESSFLMPSVGWVSRESFLSGAAVVGLQRLVAAGLELVLFHRGQLVAGLLPRWVEVLGRAGGVKVATFDTTDVYRFPEAPPAQPLTRSSVETAMTLVPIGDGPELDVLVTLASRGERPIYEARTRKLRLELGGVEGAKLAKKGRLYLSPPLLIPGFVEELRTRITLPDKAERGVELRLVDEDGERYAELGTTAFSRGAAAPACSVRFVGRDEAAGSAGTLRVVNEGAQAFASAPTLFVVEDAPAGKLVFQRPLGLFSPGSAQLVGGLPPLGRARAVVGPSPDAPWCFVTFP